MFTASGTFFRTISRRNATPSSRYAATTRTSVSAATIRSTSSPKSTVARSYGRSAASVRRLRRISSSAPPPTERP
jgi:hypothetical protein